MSYILKSAPFLVADFDKFKPSKFKSPYFSAVLLI